MVGQQDQHVDDLVHIDVVLVDKKQPEFLTKYNRVSFTGLLRSCLGSPLFSFSSSLSVSLLYVGT